MTIRRYIPSILVIISIISLIMIFRFPFFELLIQPVIYFFWAFWRLLLSIDQVYYWWFLIILTVLMLIRSISIKSEHGLRYSLKEYHEPLRDAEFWGNQIIKGAYDKNEREILQHSIILLLALAISTRERSDSSQAMETILARKADLPDFIYSFILPSKGSKGHLRMSIYFFFPKWMRRLDIRTRNSYYRSINLIFDWIGNYMEISHED